MWNYSNNSTQTTLTASAGAGDASISVGTTAGLPATYPYTLVIDYEQATAEVVTVTSAAGTTLTVTRGEDGTSATSHNIGAVVVHAVVARDVREPQQHIAASGDVHGIGGSAAVVGTTTAQTLTNKTISGSANTFVNLPASALVGTAPTLAVAGDVDVGGEVAVTRAAASSTAVSAQVTGDTVTRLRVLADGKHEWGPGGATATDSNLFRSAVGKLRTDGALDVGGDLVVEGETRLDDIVSSQVRVVRPAATDLALAGAVAADTNNRYAVKADGKTEWGTGGATADTNLYRSAADTLKTDDAFVAAGITSSGNVSVTGTVTATGNVTTNGMRAHYGQSGTVTFTFASDTSALTVVTFATPFAAAPKVYTNIDTAPGSTGRWGSRAINITTTGFSMFVFAGDSLASTWSAIPVSWTAFAV